ncbi:MAG: phosphatase PAP2 family protein [Actinobacteria bacterium]|nr:phosphatase PAP2 family protein [Actinomycetota bacterium]
MEQVQRRRGEMVTALRWSGFLFLGFLLVTQQVMSSGPLIRLDANIADAKRHNFGDFINFLLRKIDNLGLRGLTATVLILSALFIARRFKSWRPLNLAILSLLTLNLFVGVAKLAIGRTKPRLNVDLLHQPGALSYPSGHASNALLTWGMLAYLIYRYTHKDGYHGRVLSGSVFVITFSVCIVSLYRSTHWLSDLLGGLFIGGALLVLIIAIDRYFPSESQRS